MLKRTTASAGVPTPTTSGLYTTYLMLLLLWASLAASLPGCGGSRSPAESPTDAGESDDPDAEPDADSSAPEPAAAAPNCDDGTCFRCGEGICPQGAYCDLDAVGGAACAWLAECNESPSCACVTRVLGSSCSCEESQGGPQARCR